MGYSDILSPLVGPVRVVGNDEWREDDFHENLISEFLAPAIDILSDALISSSEGK